MPVIVDGVTIQECKGITTDTVNTEYVYTDTVLTYDEACCVPGSAVFDTVGTHIWTAPEGVTNIDLCMIGGGGSGGMSIDYQDRLPGGGYSGIIYNNSVNVVPGNDYTVIVGTGGAPVEELYTYGNPGSPSKFGSIVANGGAGGGINNDEGYFGNGAPRNTCAGTFYDGIPSGQSQAGYGGQAGFADGGDGGQGVIVIPGDGAFGSGGGGSYGSGALGDKTGAGGNGKVIISWDCFSTKPTQKQKNNKG